MNWQYGNPAAGTSPERPPCWGLSYDNDNRECQTRCPFRETCRQEVQRKINAQRLAPPAPAYPAAAPPQQYSYYQQAPMAMHPYAQPQPIPMAPPAPAAAPRPLGYASPAAAPQAPRPSPAGPVPQQPQAQQQAHGPTHLGIYGAISDPLHNALHSAAGPFRPQMSGESFFERWVKNMFLVGLEAVAKEVVLGIRQMWLPPAPAPQQNPPPSAQVVDVYPPKH